MSDVNPMNLEYNTCYICGDVVPKGRDVCPNCVKEHGTSVKKLKVNTEYSDDYAYDWFADGRVSDGFTSLIKISFHNINLSYS